MVPGLWYLVYLIHDAFVFSVQNLYTRVPGTYQQPTMVVYSYSDLRIGWWMNELLLLLSSHTKYMDCPLCATIFVICMMEASKVDHSASYVGG